MSDSKPKAEIEIHRKVYWEGVALSIGPDADGLGCVRIHAATKDAEAYWGQLDVSFPPEAAAAIGQALIAAASERAQ